MYGVYASSVPTEKASASVKAERTVLENVAHKLGIGMEDVDYDFELGGKWNKISAHMMVAPDFGVERLVGQCGLLGITLIECIFGPNKQGHPTNTIDLDYLLRSFYLLKGKRIRIDITFHEEISKNLFMFSLEFFREGESTPVIVDDMEIEYWDDLTPERIREVVSKGLM